MFRPTPNAFAPIDQDVYWRTGGDPNIHYLHGYWSLAPDEALVIEIDPPECQTWNFQLDNWWMESLDHERQMTINKHTAKLDDGRLTIVVADKDPGWGNWIDTCGHTSGTALLRWLGADHHPLPECKVIDLGQTDLEAP
jgi:hypothetical protein